MISQFKPASRFMLILSAGLTVILCCLTFTRAAEPKRKAAQANESKGQAQSKPQEGPGGQAEIAEAGLDALKNHLKELSRQIEQEEAQVTELRQQLKISDVESNAESLTSLGLEMRKKLEAVRIEAFANHARAAALLAELQRLSRTELRNTLPTASPDPLLSDLLSKLAATEEQLTSLLRDFTEDNPEVRRLVAVKVKIDQQLEERIDGMMKGLRAQVNSLEAQSKNIEEELDKEQAKDIAREAKSRPYFAAMRDLETRKKMRDTLLTRLMQEQLDAAMPRKSRY